MPVPAPIIVDVADGTRVEYRAIHPALGVEIRGVDLSKPVSGALRTELNHALDLHSLLLFPEQDLAPDDELTAVRLFNEISDSDYNDSGLGIPGYPQIVVLSNIIGDDGVPLGYCNKRGMEWHTDGSGWQLPPVASSLYAVEAPATGGETFFVNGAMAWDALPRARRAEIEHMQCTYSYVTLHQWLAAASGRPDTLTEEQQAKYPDVVRPLVRTHPTTGRKALWFSIEEITQIDDLSYEASRELMLELIEFIMSDPHIMYVHRWQPREIILWDNRSLLHSVCDYNYEGQRRLMHQITGKDLAFAV